MNTKNILASKTIWGVLIAAAPTVAALFGYRVSDNFGIEASALVDQLISLGGLALAAYGRLKATTSLVVRAAPETKD